MLPSQNARLRQIRNYLPTSRLVSVRYKSKTKIPVQLHKDFSGLGIKGEVVRVFPGRMRNQLHPYNGASYVLEGKPLRLPLVTRAEAAAEEARRMALNSPSVNQTATEKNEAAEVDYSQLAFLNFPKSKGIQESAAEETTNAAAAAATTSTPTEDLYALHNALNSLPSALNIKLNVLENGLLTELYTVDMLCDYVSSLIGFQVDPAKTIFKVVVSPRGQTATTKALDFYGTYNVVFGISATAKITKKVCLLPDDGATPPSVEIKRPYDLPLPVQPELPKQTAGSEATNATKTEPQEGSESQNDKKSFPWENDFISELEKRIRK